MSRRNVTGDAQLPANLGAAQDLSDSVLDVGPENPAVSCTKRLYSSPRLI